LRTSEILTKAAEAIQTQGFTQGGSGWHWETGKPICIEGGILAALGVQWNSLSIEDESYEQWMKCPARIAVADYLETTEMAPRLRWAGYGPDSEREIWRYNDDESTTEAEVIAVLLSAAKAEREKENGS
jgi:hypothetical protein